MTSYSFSLDKYEIKRTRSLRKDTNYITAALSVNGQAIGNPQTRFMGDQDDGSYPVDFRWPDVQVGEDSQVTLLYQIMNSGNKNHVEMEKALTSVAQSKLAGVASSDWKGELVKWAGSNALKLLFADCDGPIAPAEGRNIVWHTWELKQLKPGATGQEHVDEHGNDSPRGCGKNSHYVVYFSVTAH